jgi:hypothetical protein
MCIVCRWFFPDNGVKDAGRLDIVPWRDDLSVLERIDGGRDGGEEGCASAGPTGGRRPAGCDISAMCAEVVSDIRVNVCDRNRQAVRTF